MAENVPFCDLIRRIRAGDQQAMADLWRNYKEAICVMIRGQLTDPGLRRLLDSEDIAQSVWKDLFAKIGAGRYDLDQPDQLLRLLTTMVQNKIKNHACHQQAARRDHRRNDKRPPKEDDWIDPRPDPSEQVALHELLAKARSRLSPEEQQLGDLRAAGHSWAEIAALVGGSPDALRVRWGRAVARVKRLLDPPSE